VSTPAETVDEQAAEGRVATEGAPLPGVIVIFSRGQAMAQALPVGDSLVLGREDAVLAVDERLSRRHVRIDRALGQWRIRDLESRNGTFVDGVRIEKSSLEGDLCVVRIGQTVLLLVPDVRPFERHPVGITAGVVMGPALHGVAERIRVAAVAGDNLLVHGESGTGKEWAATTFHRLSVRANGPLVSVNCATIPHGLAERLLLGAQRGAYSGAVDTEGYVRAAHGGVLFLDELGEIEREVQPKLLRVLEAREVTPLGGTRAHPVDVRFCFATNRDLRAAVAADGFRADLFYRIEQPSVVLPPLRSRREEIPWLVTLELGRVAPPPIASAGFVEACLLRHWPGNVRELMRHVRRASQVAAAEGAPELLARHLDAQAGQPISGAVAETEVPRVPELTSEQVRDSLATHSGNVSAAARALGLHRTQLRRLIARFGLND
jgi:transcriptional regulator with GAF, ATPase, and Fis domain